MMARRGKVEIDVRHGEYKFEGYTADEVSAMLIKIAELLGDDD